MPIKLRCQCGKSLHAPDSAAGKAVKCPGCGKPLKVPAAGNSGGSPTPPSKNPAKVKSVAQRKVAAPTISGVDDIGSLFDEEGFSAKVESVCPACRKEMPRLAVLCTNCGYHRESGTQFERHKTISSDADKASYALSKAADDLVKERAMQAELLKGGGMPWWMLVLVLVIGGGALGIAVLGVNASNQESDVERPGILASILLLTSGTFLFASVVCFLIIAFHAFRQSIVKGLLSLFVFPFYIFYHVFQNWSAVGKVFLLAVALGIGSGGAYWLSNNVGTGEPKEDNGGLEMVL